MSAGTRGDLMLLGRLTAALELIGRTGADGFQIEYDDDTGYERMPVVWWAGANWQGTRKFSDLFPYPAQAAEDLLSRVINGGHCAHCRKVSVVGMAVEGLCGYTLHVGDVDDPATYHYRRGCGR